MSFVAKFRQAVDSIVQVVKSVLFGSREKVFSVEINGDKDFCGIVKETIFLLKERDLATFECVDKHLELIIQGKTQFLSPLQGGATLTLSKEDVTEGTRTWLACLLSYQAYRTKLYCDHAKHHKRLSGIPKSVYSGDKAWDFMYDCLKKIGGSYDEMKHLSDFVEAGKKNTEPK